MTQARVEYLAAGANRHPSAADWNEDGVLAFGADRNIALWEPEVCDEEEWDELGHGTKETSLKPDMPFMKP